MPTTTHNIVLGAEGDPVTTASAGDKITWTNSTGYNISSFTLPSCVGGQSPAPIAVGATTGEFTINAGSKKQNYPYSWIQDDGKRDPRGGTIDVN